MNKDGMTQIQIKYFLKRINEAEIIKLKESTDKMRVLLGRAEYRAKALKALKLPPLSGTKIKEVITKYAEENTHWKYDWGSIPINLFLGVQFCDSTDKNWVKASDAQHRAIAKAEKSIRAEATAVRDSIIFAGAQEAEAALQNFITWTHD